MVFPDYLRPVPALLPVVFTPQAAAQTQILAAEDTVHHTHGCRGNHSLAHTAPADTDAAGDHDTAICPAGGRLYGAGRIPYRCLFPATDIFGDRAGRPCQR
ncbi:hypothetical protein UA45_22570 [Morganella morganii]|uniref:Uncharacterized protein n=1 Tax=Morganella morganii TaxID=582 RepID=A0A0D8L1S7_MORMO|nr:hypothetical protein UA45_22570 [Morganella morganii]